MNHNYMSWKQRCKWKAKLSLQQAIKNDKKRKAKGTK